VIFSCILSVSPLNQDENVFASVAELFGQPNISFDKLNVAAFEVIIIRVGTGAAAIDVILLGT
jgi:hypothetical protein